MKEAVHNLDLMEQRGFRAYSDVCARLLLGFAKMKALADGKGVHSHIIKSRFKLDIFLGNSLLSMYCKCGSVVDARQVFDIMPERNVISWTAMIAGLVQQGHGEEAFELFWRMQREGVKPNKVTFMSILNACASPVTLIQGKRLHSGIIKAGLESDVHVGTALVSMYCKCGSLVDARQVFDKLPIRDVVSWTVMIAGSVQHGHGEEAFELFQQMQKEGMKPNKVTFISILKACTTQANLEQGKHVHLGIIKAGLSSDVQVATDIVSMYCNCRSVVDARRVFDRMPNRDVVSWTAMITGSAQHDHGQAFELFLQMQQEGVKPNKVTFISILNACAIPESLEQGKLLHEGIINARVESDVQVGTALVSMYFKCGSVVDARRMFLRMLERNVVTWNAMIGGLVQRTMARLESKGLFSTKIPISLIRDMEMIKLGKKSRRIS